MVKHFLPFAQLNPDEIAFSLGTDRNGKTTISMVYQPAGGEVATATAAPCGAPPT